MSLFSPQTQLTLTDIELNIFLGWSDSEQSQRQAILLDIEIKWGEAPLACQNDQLSDTVCYHTLIDAISEHISQKKFRLIEHLAHDIYHFVKQSLPNKTKMNIGVTKFPKIKNLKGPVKFNYGDA